MKSKKQLGRPLGNKGRTTIHKILSTIKTGYPYEIWRMMQVGYKEVPIILRDVYYNINKGIELKLWAPKKITVNNRNSWEGITGRRLLTIKKPYKVSDYEKQMILDVARLVRKVIIRYKELKIEYMQGRILPFTYYLDKIAEEEKIDLSRYMYKKVY